MWILFLITTLIFLSTSIVLFFYLNRTAQYLFAIEDIVIEMSERIAYSRDKIERINEMPVATDTPEIRLVVETVREVSDVVASVSALATGVSEFSRKRRVGEEEES